MAETALSMAKSILGSAVSKVASAAGTEISLLMGVQKEMWFIKDELKTMQAFLLDPQVTEKKDKLVKVWAEQVRDLSYDIEDCLDEFMVHVESQRLLKQLMKLKDRHRIAIQIRNLKSRIEEVSSRNARYNLIRTVSSNTTDETDSNMEDIRNQSASNVDEAELVGFDRPKKELIKLLYTNDMDGRAKVICVVGMGGLGKTTLARKTYETKDDTMKNFHYRAWITVSQSFSKRGMLEDMIKEFFGANTLQNLCTQLAGKMWHERDLAIYLRDRLKDKRYFIVLDDLWNINDWKWISDIALPSNDSIGSRIIITTRDINLARQCTSELLVYELKPLEICDAKMLLLRKTNKRQEDMAIDEHLRNIVPQLVKRCGCLPLAILTIGGVLATKKTSEWANFYSKLPSELENNQSLAVLRRMVNLSYNYLPSHLKPCFLYLSIFPEDSEIQRRRLVDRWIAEGFVRAEVGTILEVGESYFNELLNRSMILPSGVNIEGNVKSCRVHDIVRDVIVSFSREENFAYFIQGNGSNVQVENFRHVAYLDRECPKAGMDWSHIRSLTFFTDGSMDLDLTPSICSAKFRMLRVLDLVGEVFRITQNGFNIIMFLCHLKYLNIRTWYSLIYSVPRSVAKVKGLQILDLGPCYITTLPKEITELRDLHSIRCNSSGYRYFHRGQPMDCLLGILCLPITIADSQSCTEMIANIHMGCSRRWSQSDGVRVPRGIGNLKELQILEALDIRRTSSKAVKELEELTQLRKLAVETEGATKKKCKILFASIEKLSSLRSLSVGLRADKHQDRGLGWLVSSSSPPPHLRSLKLKGYIGEMTDWFRNLTQLVKIYLYGSQLKEDKTMEILGELPQLMLLHISLGSYLGEKLVFGTRAFHNLRKLIIWHLRNLTEMTFEEGTSPKMEVVETIDCKFASGITGIKHLPRLKEISLGRGSKVARLSMLEEEVNGHQNHPALRLQEDRKDHDLGDVGGPMEPVADHTGQSSQVITLPTTDSEIQPASS